MAPATLFVGTYTRKEGHVDGKGLGVYAFSFDEAQDGALTPLGVTEVGINPTFLCGTHSTLYLVNECDEPSTVAPGEKTGFVRALAIGEQGALQELSRQETRGTFPAHVALSPRGDFVSVANYGGGSLALFPVDGTDGSLSAASDLHVFPGASMAIPDRQEASHIHSTVWASPDAVFAADLGNDQVAQFTLDSAAKKLTNEALLARPAGSGPRHFALLPERKVGYVLGELDSVIGVHALDVTTGRLASEPLQNISALPEGYAGVASLAADIHLSSCKRFLFASNRFQDSVACFRLLEDATLELVGHVPTRGRTPRNFLVHKELLLVANQDSDSIDVFRVDASGGSIVYTGQSVACPSPVSLFIRP